MYWMFLFQNTCWYMLSFIFLGDICIVICDMYIILLFCDNLHWDEMLSQQFILPFIQFVACQNLRLYLTYRAFSWFLWSISLFDFIIAPTKLVSSYTFLQFVWIVMELCIKLIWRNWSHKDITLNEWRAEFY